MEVKPSLGGGEFRIMYLGVIGKPLEHVKKGTETT